MLSNKNTGKKEKKKATAQRGWLFNEGEIEMTCWIKDTIYTLDSEQGKV